VVVVQQVHRLELGLLAAAVEEANLAAAAAASAV
jgi:hypothetical protein